MIICYLSLGSNLGNRRKNIEEAIKKINALNYTKVIKKSKFHKTKPEGGPPGQPEYLNAAIKIKTKLSPALLLKELQKIEKELGRVKTVRFGPRPIDCDILLYGSKLIRQKGLIIPHPRMFGRDFVLKPLSEVI